MDQGASRICGAIHIIGSVQVYVAVGGAVNVFCWLEHWDLQGYYDWLPDAVLCVVYIFGSSVVCGVYGLVGGEVYREGQCD